MHAEKAIVPITNRLQKSLVACILYIAKLSLLLTNSFSGYTLREQEFLHGYKDITLNDNLDICVKWPPRRYKATLPRIYMFSHV